MAVNPLVHIAHFLGTNGLGQVKFIDVKKQMLQGSNTDLFNPLASKAHNSECPNIRTTVLIPLQFEPVKVGQS